MLRAMSRKFYGRYRILATLGKGGFGCVYLAEHKLLETRVAIKVLHGHLTAGVDPKDKKAVERFWREARVMGHLDHPGIVPIHSFENQGDEFYLVMPLREGGTLRKRIAQGALPPAEARRIFVALCAALGYAHKRNITHRDLKPENLLFNADDDLSIADFGLARFGDESARFTGEGDCMGTPHYMAPETVSKGSAQADHLVDLYAVGCILYEMLTGKAPFDSDKRAPLARANAIFDQHASAPRPLPSAARPGLNAIWDAVVTALMAVDPAERPPNAGAALEMLTAREEKERAHAAAESAQRQQEEEKERLRRFAEAEDRWQKAEEERARLAAEVRRWQQKEEERVRRGEEDFRREEELERTGTRLPAESHRRGAEGERRRQEEERRLLEEQNPPPGNAASPSGNEAFAEKLARLIAQAEAALGRQQQEETHRHMERAAAERVRLAAEAERRRQEEERRPSEEQNLPPDRAPLPEGNAAFAEKLAHLIEQAEHKLSIAQARERAERDQHG